MSIKSNGYSERLLGHITKAAQFLCAEGRFGDWGTTRTSGNAIWALSDCGLVDTHPDFIAYCTRQLVESEECARDTQGIRFNEEVWDTSVALIGMLKGAKGQFRDEVEAIVKWLLSQAQQDNFDNEPWETLWALLVLLEFDARRPDISSLVKRCIPWLLNRRNTQGILISTHYMGFLLMVLNLIMSRLDLTSEEEHLYSESIATCESYLRSEFLGSRGTGLLWGNEPWIIGHILLGVSGCPNAGPLFFQDSDFNSHLVNWYDKLDWQPTAGGWGDLVETSFTLIGLVNYYREREANLRGGKVNVADIVKEINSKISFRFDERTSLKMTVYPIWRKRKIPAGRDLCFVLMPFGAGWSDRIYRKLRDILRRRNLTSKRADEMYQADIMEDIWYGINQCRIVIAECTGKNPNVFYELGIAHTLGKDVIILTQNEDDIPFDLKRFRYIKYEDNDDGYRKLREQLSQHINALLKGR